MEKLSCHFTNEQWKMRQKAETFLVITTKKNLCQTISLRKQFPYYFFFHRSINDLTCKEFMKEVQYRTCTLLIPVPKVEHSKLCPLTAVLHAFKLARVLQQEEHTLGPAFTDKQDGIFTPLTYSVFTNILKLSLNKCGIDTPKYSGHSFYRGGATFAQSCSVSEHYMKLQGNWCSNAYVL